MGRFNRVAVLLAISLLLVGTSVGAAAAAGTVPSHLSLAVNNPSCVGCTVSMTVSLSLDDYGDPPARSCT